MKPQGYIPASAEPGAREGADLDTRAVVKAAVVMGAILIFMLGALALFFSHLEANYPARTSEASPLVTASELPPVPRLQTDPLRDLQAVRAEEDVHLEQYGWVDRGQGVARIPIERAMEIWVKNYSVSPNAAPPAGASGVSELQMRQEKAMGGAHAP